ncbi:MAG: peptidylprolyl isomerase [Flavobacteriales bacterium]|nr:peptidylprolyl isomerase [Flavobacteriales bacterium]MCB9447696.1 peptidylprolyl isomerase [Flavobacteriales bacterium]
MTQSTKYNSYLFRVRIGLLVVLLLPLSRAAAQNDEPSGVPVNRVIATVGNDVVLQSDLENQYLQMMAQGMTPDADTRCRILEDQLFQKLLKNQAELDSVTVSDNQVESELDRRIEYFIKQIGSEEALEEYYGKSIIEIKAEFRDMVQDQLLVQTMQGKITKDVKVSPSEVKQFFNNIPKDSLPYINSEVEMAQVVKMPEVSQEEKDKVLAKLEEYRQRVISGSTSFAALARIYSEDPSYKQGGEIGFVSRGDLVPEFETVAFRLTPIETVDQKVDSTQAVLTQLQKMGGENLEQRLNQTQHDLDSLKNMRCSQVVESQFGYHLIQLIERRGQQVNVRHILIRPKLTEEEKLKSQQFLDSVRTLVMNGKYTFAEAVEKFSDDEDTRYFDGNIVNPATGTTKFEMDQLDPMLSFTVNPMSVDNISNPIQFQKPDGKEGYRIILLKTRTSPHQLNLKDDYKKVMDMATMDKQAKAVSDWIEKKRDNMYIHIADDFKNCSFMNNWVN